MSIKLQEQTKIGAERRFVMVVTNHSCGSSREASTPSLELRLFVFVGGLSNSGISMTWEGMDKAQHMVGSLLQGLSDQRSRTAGHPLRVY